MATASVASFARVRIDLMDIYACGIWYFAVGNTRREITSINDIFATK